MKGNFVSFYLKGDLIKVTCRNVGLDIVKRPLLLQTSMLRQCGAFRVVNAGHNFFCIKCVPIY